MPRKKKSSASTKPPLPETTQEAYDKTLEILVKIKAIMDDRNEACREIQEFQTRIGKKFASDMNAKERAEAKALYARLSPKICSGGNSMGKYLDVLKNWRELATDEAKDKNELNAIELMKTRHGCLSIMNIEENPEPYGAGAVSWPENKRLKKKEEVAAFVDDTKTWILAEVAGSVSNHRYECIDIDDREKKVATFARKQLIPLPRYTVFYDKYPFMAIRERGIVLAVFPGTTCFYEGIVSKPPSHVSGMYEIRFVDTSKPDNYGEPTHVPERYVIPFKKDPKMYIRPEKREELIAKGKMIEAPKKERKAKMVEVISIEELDPDVIDEKDVPGPAPKPNYYESPDEDEKKVKKGKGKGKKQTKKPKKVKILRAKVPEHKKRVSTRQFGKRRVKRKKKVVPEAAVTGESSTAGKEGEAPEEERAEEVEREAEDDFQDARADLPDEVGNAQEEKEEEEKKEKSSDSEESEDDKDQEKEEEQEQEQYGEVEEMDDSGEVNVEETEGQERQSSESSENSSDSDDSDDSDDEYPALKRPANNRVMRESDLSESERSSSSSSSSDDDDNRPSTSG